MMASKSISWSSPRQDPLLVIVPSVPIAKEGNKLIIDEKAISGLYLYLEFWPGPVRCIFREGDRSNLLFAKAYDAGVLPFEIKTISANAPVPDELIADAA